VYFEGEMVPLDQDRDGRVVEFALLNRYSTSKWDPRPTAVDVIVITMVPGRHAQYDTRRLRVWGTLRVALELQDGLVYCIYRMEGDRVEMVR
jgi:hypothetical protein